MAIGVGCGGGGGRGALGRGALGRRALERGGGGGVRAAAASRPASRPWQVRGSFPFSLFFGSSLRLYCSLS